MAVSAARHLEYEKLRYAERRALGVATLGGVCARPDCHETAELQFDHVDPREKSFSLSANWSIALDKWLAELSKCQLLCVPHHKEKTRKDADLYGVVVHSRWRYLSKHRCRCDECRADYSVYRRFRAVNGLG